MPSFKVFVRYTPSSYRMDFEHEERIGAQRLDLIILEPA
jgi:hypothetical protein